MINKLKIYCFASCLFLFGKLYCQEIETGTAKNDTISFDDEISIPNEIDWNLHNLYSWHISNSEDKREDCNGNGINPQFTDQEYTERLSKLPNVIELPYNKIVRSFIDLYLVKNRDQVEKMLGLGVYYFPIFEQALDANNMPIELKYLPVIESALNPLAFSKAGASGLWQFMFGTGRIYGLEINSLVDERRDPIKSTQAGVKYLKDLYNIYGDWHLAIAAYNCGPGNVNKAIRRSGGKRDYWQIYYYLPKETRGYVPAFIAANYVMNYYSLHNLCPLKVNIPIYTDTILVKERLHLEQVASVLQIPIEQLRSINPQYKKDIVPGNACPYALCLPLNYTDSFIERKDSILAYKADVLINTREEVTPTQAYQPAGNKIYYKVRSGDYLGKIASKYNVSITNLKKWNHLRSNSIQIGQRLVIYTNNSHSSSSSYSDATTYKVRQGDNLWLISKKFPGITSADIAKANNLNNGYIRAGQILKIPQK